MVQNVIEQILTVDGMTCANCEMKIEKKLKNTAGIISADVSYSTDKVKLSFDQNKIKTDEIKGIIQKLGYQVVESAQKPSQQLEFGKLLSIAIIIFSLYTIINHFGIFNIFNLFPQVQQGMSYGMLFVIGLLTSVHCIAMCGGINLSQCIPQYAKQDNSRFGALKPTALYNLGRVLSYTVIGAIVGGLGSVISFSGTTKGFVQIIAGVFMIIMGLNMLNLFPWLRRFNPRMPKFLTAGINERKKSNSAFYVGILNGLMPCGPLQSMQLYALSTASPIQGALSMLVFSLGTVPLMFGLGTLSSFLNKKFKHNMMAVSSVLVILLGLFMFGNGISLAGFVLPTVAATTAQTSTQSTSTSSNKSAKANTDGVAQITDGVQTVTINLSSGSYKPITVQKGVPVKWIIKAEANQINGCNNTLIVQKYNVQKKLVPGDNIIEFTPTESGTIGYSCWMGMIRSKINVVDDLSAR
jgi:sulfite exporter TauE/SafE/copper chaperone CopZ